jgi:hypothetical protein
VLAAGRVSLRLRCLLDRTLRGNRFCPGMIRRGRRIAPPRKDESRLRLPNVGGKQPVPLGRTRLPPQRSDALLHIGNDLVQTGEVRLGRAELLLGILAADVQPGDARRLLQHLSAFLRPGGDDCADPPLADQRGGVCPRCGIGEQQGDILRPRIAPVDPVRGSRAALDPADHLDLVTVALCQDRHFSEVARGAGCGAGEDHVFHAGTAQRPGRSLAHGPSHRFQQVRFSAAIGADDTRQPRLDAKFSRLYKALEAG